MLWVYGHYKCFTFSVQGNSLHWKSKTRNFEKETGCKLAGLTYLLYLAINMDGNIHLQHKYFYVPKIGNLKLNYFGLTFFKNVHIQIHEYSSSDTALCDNVISDNVSVGKTTNHAVVMATLYVNGENCGMQGFLVQLRDIDTHQPLPGMCSW